MDWATYFGKTDGIGILGTADAAGAVDVAVYAKPRIIEGDTIAFVMRPGLSHQNLRATVKAAYMFIEKGQGYEGRRLYLTKLREETDAKIIEEMRKGHKHSWHKDTDEAYLVYFRIDEVRPLVGDAEL
jgi:hypothetical protein